MIKFNPGPSGLLAEPHEPWRHLAPRSPGSRRRGLLNIVVTTHHSYVPPPPRTPRERKRRPEFGIEAVRHEITRTRREADRYRHRLDEAEALLTAAYAQQEGTAA